jgi:ribokinase
VGQDPFGERLIGNLKDQGVDGNAVQIDPDAATGTAVILVEANGENRIVLSPGANGRVTPADVKKAASMFKTARYLLLQLEIPLETVEFAAHFAKKHGMEVLLNPAPAQKLPGGLLEDLDFLIPNETELQLLTGLPVDDLEQVERAARQLLAKGVKQVITTLGARGALLVEQTRTVPVPAQQVNVVDTTAAGDAFIGGLAAALQGGMDLEEAVRYANCCGALTVTRFGAQPSLPVASEVEEFCR